MAFTRVKPGSWAVNEELTSAQMNSLDIDHSNAVDKTGDVITSGTISLASSGKINATIHDSLVSTADSGISTAVSHGISINNDTGLVLEGTTCWPAFRSARTDQRVWPIIPVTAPTGWAYNGTSLTGTSYSWIGQASSTNDLACDITDYLINGATLVSAEMVFIVSAAHASIAGMVLPKMSLQRYGVTVGIGNVQTTLDVSDPIALATPGSAAAYVNGNLSQSLVYTCTRNNVIDKTQYRYAAIMRDENGSNSVPGSTFVLGLRLIQSVSNMQAR